MAIFEELKSIGKVLQEAGKIEQYQQILDTQQKLLEMQGQIAELEESNKKLQEEFEIKGALIPEDNVYWTQKDNIKDGPFCTCCWDSERILMRLHKGHNSDRMHCPKCNTVAKGGTAHVFRPIDHGRNSTR